VRPSRAAVAVAAILTATGVFVPFTPPAQAAPKRHVIVVAPAGTYLATLTLAGIADTQDTGLIATSHAAGVTGQFSFTDFAVTP
jgi:hypothetical protein